MPDKKIVDDYYSQIDSSKDSNSNENDKNKPKIVAKKKIIVKKPKILSENNESISSSDSTDNKGKNFKENFKKNNNHKGFVQKIEVVKTHQKQESEKNKDFKKESNNKFKPKKVENVLKPDNKFNKEKKSGKDEKKTDSTVKFKLRNNIQKKSDNNKFDDSDSKKNLNKKSNKFNTAYENESKGKKNKFSTNDKLSRGKFNYSNDKDVFFVRSNKTNKKLEKKVEDIKQNLVEKIGETVIVPDVLTLKELSEKLGVILPKLMAEFMKNGLLVNINSKIDFDSASIVAESFDIKLEKDNSLGASVKDIMSGNVNELLKEEDKSKLLPRSPVVSIMGHVDHGKTSLLDYIRKAKVAFGEAGGITQSIGAYQVELDKGKITFLDTPGHEAFTIMRARGAKLTDIAILVVAADEGVKPQTIESINHAKEAGIPIIVAINKMDKVGANPDYVKGQLAEQGLTAEDWGGDIPMVPVSAHTGFGIDDLLEIILLVAEMKELGANPDRAGIATVIESHLDSKLGPVASVLVNTGTVHVGDNIVCQDSYGKIKVLKNYGGKNVKFVTPGEPALIVGLDKVINGGDILQVVNTVELAKTKAEEYRTIMQKQKDVGASGLALLMSKIRAGSLKQLKIVLKADTNGSLEAIRGSLLKLSTPEITVQIIHAGVGSVNEGDVLMGQGSDALLVGYSVGVLPTAKGVLESTGVEFITSDIIYHITEKVEKIVTGMLDTKEIDVNLGKAKVGGIFFTGKGFYILGLVIPPNSKIESRALVRIIRKKKFVGNGVIESLKSGTIEVKELEGPIECGVNLKTSVIIELGDDLEIHKIEVQK